MKELTGISHISIEKTLFANNNISHSVYLLLSFSRFAVYRASCRLPPVLVLMACFTQKLSQQGARKSDRSSMTLPLGYAIADGDKNCIGVVCPPFMITACHLSCAVRLNMRVNTRRPERLMQGRSEQQDSSSSTADHFAEVLCAFIL